MRSLVSGLLRLDRRVGAYLFGLVFGFRAERTYGNHPGYRNETSSGFSSRSEALSAEAQQRAVASSFVGGAGA